MVSGHHPSKMITLTDPSIMCSVPLQLEKILDGEKGGRAGGGGGMTHHSDGGEEAQTAVKKATDVFRADPSWLDTRECI